MTKTVETDNSEAKVFFRAPKTLIDSLDAICQSTNQTRAEKLRELVEDLVSKNSGVKVQPRFNYEAESNNLEALRTKRNRLEKYLREAKTNSRYNRRILSVMYELSLDLEFGNKARFSEEEPPMLKEPHLSSLIKKLYNYAGNPQDKDRFSSDNLEDWIKYLELTVEINNLRTRINEYRTKMSDEKQLAFSYEKTALPNGPELANTEDQAKTLPVETVEESKFTVEEDNDQDVETDSSDDESHSENENGTEEF